VNWLAHLLLSEPSSAFRLGNLLPDLLNAAELADMPAAFQRGIECHRRIDAFTDTHAVVRRSVQRVPASHRRFAPVAVDVFYDHFLSTDWEAHSPQPLSDFLGEVQASFAEHHALLPEVIQDCLLRMRTENWLGSYRELPGVWLTLERIGRRFRRPVALGGMLVELERHYRDFAGDFAEFFPQLRAHVESSYALSSVR
jgi:acyl carrier protein phosphodiesterase